MYSNVTNPYPNQINRNHSPFDISEYTWYDPTGNVPLPASGHICQAMYYPISNAACPVIINITLMVTHQTLGK